MGKILHTYRYGLAIGITAALLTATASAASAQQVHDYTVKDSFGNIVAAPIPIGGFPQNSQPQSYTTKDSFGNTIATPIPLGSREVVIGERTYYNYDYYPRGRRNINNSTLINPVLVNPNIRNSTIINPTIINDDDYSWVRVPVGRRSRVILKW